MMSSMSGKAESHEERATTGEVRERPTGYGIDKTLIRQRLRLTPAERARLAVEDARNLQRLRERIRR